MSFLFHSGSLDSVASGSVPTPSRLPEPLIIGARRIDIVRHVLAIRACSRSASRARRIPASNVLWTDEAAAASVGAIRPISRIPLYLLLQIFSEYLCI
jgi:hypothetical protein